MPNPQDSNPPPAPDRLMKQAAAARFIEVHRQYIPVMIGRGELETELVDGVPYVTRQSAELAKEARRVAREAKQKKSRRSAA